MYRKKRQGPRPWILDNVKGCVLPLLSFQNTGGTSTTRSTWRSASDVRRAWADASRVAYVVKKVELATHARLGVKGDGASLYSEHYSHVLRIYDNASSIDVLLSAQYCMDGGTFMDENDWLEITALDYGKLVKLSGVELRLLPLASGHSRFILVASRVEIVNAVSTNVTGSFPDTSSDGVLSDICNGINRFFVLNALALDPGPPKPTPSECEYPSESDGEILKSDGELIVPEEALNKSEVISEPLGSKSAVGPNCASPGSDNGPKPTHHAGASSSQNSQALGEDGEALHERLGVSAAAASLEGGLSDFEKEGKDDTHQHGVQKEGISEDLGHQSGCEKLHALKCSHSVNELPVPDRKSRVLSSKDNEADGNRNKEDDIEDDDNEDNNNEDDENEDDEENEAGRFVSYDIIASCSSLSSCLSEAPSATSSASVPNRKSNCSSSPLPPPSKSLRGEGFVRAALRAALRSSLLAFFREHDEDFLPNVDDLISKYLHAPDERKSIESLFEMLEEKYQARPCYAVDRGIEGSSKASAAELQGPSHESESRISPPHAQICTSSSADPSNTQVAPWNSNDNDSYECSQESQSQALISSGPFPSSNSSGSSRQRSGPERESSNGTQSDEVEARSVKPLNVMDPHYNPFQPRKRARLSGSSSSSPSSSFASKKEAATKLKGMKSDEDQSQGPQQRESEALPSVGSSSDVVERPHSLWNEEKRTAWIHAQPPGLATRAFGLASGNPKLFKSAARYLSRHAASADSLLSKFRSAAEVEGAD